MSDPFARAVAQHRLRALEPGAPVTAADGTPAPDGMPAPDGGELIRVDFQPVPDGDSAIEA
ncbi:hypothetical protein [Microbacterium oleivorans]|uniref:Uncharacterized protein n=1 Tax=Microbacterium oleivorans TaxID=273677 RepID=A0A7D5EWA1_9MICO|nr:hypothetical protein [Microbacterium oleivorans]QLD10770.1 hypothetical protein HW566_02615 [Microbacterium oleivorans]